MRFMHIADVHLGAAPDHGYLWAQDRGRELWESFRSCMMEANEKKVDLLLISGDLFHRQPEPHELKEVNYLFSTLERTIVVLIAGNHDYIRPGSPYLTFPWNDNVVCLFDSSCERIRLPELRTEVYGFSYYQQEIREPLYDGLIADPNDYHKILVAHGGDAEHIPMTKEQLQKTGFDYIALGHIHKPQVYVQDLAMYAGALEPIDCNDVGPHGYVLGEMHRKKCKFTFVPFAQREYRWLKIEVEGTDTSYSIREKIASEIRRQGPRHMYRISLEGQRHPQLRFSLQEYMKCGRVIDVVDKTIPAFPLEELRLKYKGQLIGNYIESFGDGPKGTIEEKALQYGLEALLHANR